MDIPVRLVRPASGRAASEYRFTFVKSPLCLHPSKAVIQASMLLPQDNGESRGQAFEISDTPNPGFWFIGVSESNQCLYLLLIVTPGKSSVRNGVRGKPAWLNILTTGFVAQP
ncbi:MAG: hypothetical protein JWM11_1264 [Planctomycetaceae bacterium]|nr:hypothetical protein [Planctomycetaceae bacterium]